MGVVEVGGLGREAQAGGVEGRLALGDLPRLVLELGPVGLGLLPGAVDGVGELADALLERLRPVESSITRVARPPFCSARPSTRRAKRVRSRAALRWASRQANPGRVCHVSALVSAYEQRVARSQSCWTSGSPNTIGSRGSPQTLVQSAVTSRRVCSRALVQCALAASRSPSPAASSPAWNKASTVLVPSSGLNANGSRAAQAENAAAAAARSPATISSRPAT